MKPLTVLVDGQPVSVPPGSMATAAVFAAGKSFRESVTGEPRAALCGMGVCYECRVTIDGRPHVRACQTRVEGGFYRTEIQTEDASRQPKGSVAKPAGRSYFGELYELFLSAEIVVVGAGPAGLSAADAAARAGAKVLLLDDSPGDGGQIWRGAKRRPGLARRVASHPNVDQRFGARVVAKSGDKTLLVETSDGVRAIRFGKLILATGARERFLPFPGWTLPGVCGAGGLQALVKTGTPIAGKRVAVAGTGPLLLAVAAHLKASGATVVGVFEQADTEKLVRFGAGLVRSPAKISQAIGLGAKLIGVPIRPGWWPTRADGHGKLESVTFTNGRTTRTIPVDFLACGFDLLPQIELATLLGCESKNGAVVVDNSQQSSMENIFVVGEATGIGGLEKSIVEGRIAGLSAVGRQSDAEKFFAERMKTHAFAKKLAETFALRPELLALADDDTIVCRCEDVTLGAVKGFADARSAKLQTRCGMGACQGRICGGALAALCGWDADSVRPPALNCRLETLAKSPTEPLQENSL